MIDIVDIKPNEIEEIYEFITKSVFHPVKDYIFFYGTNRGSVKVCDMRTSAMCDKYNKLFGDVPTTQNPSALTSCILDIKVDHSDKYLLARDHLKLKLWDMRMEHLPLFSIFIENNIDSKLKEPHTIGSTKDKFDCCFDRNVSSIITGSHSSRLNIYDMSGNKTASIYVDKNDFACKEVSEICEVNLAEKTYCSSWHPEKDIVAFSALNNLFIIKRDKK